jgi:putative endonuclease
MDKPCTYILYSAKWDQYYIGCTQNMKQRLEAHNQGKNKSTKGGAPWQLCYQESFDSMQEARQREYALKKKKSRKYLEWLISSAG